MLVGFDIGGTKIEVKVLADKGQEIYKSRVNTPDNYEEFLNCISAMVLEVEKEIGSFNSIGLGIPGAICPTTGLMKNANRAYLNGRDVLNDVSIRANKLVAIANDANCFALSEAVDGAGKGGQIVFGVILGTGCGGGIVVNQQVLVGANAITGEWGHNPLPGYDPSIDGEPVSCYCGRDNCIEQFISGTGFSNRFNTLHSTEFNSKEIIESVERGDKDAVEAYQLLVDQISRSLASIVNILDPDAIVLGGGLSNVESLYYDLPHVMRKYIYSHEPKINVAKAKYGDSSGVRGAAWLVRK